MKYSSLVLLLLFLLPTVPSAVADSDSAHDKEVTGAVSYWGVIPGPSDSTSAHFEQRPVPLWEKTLNVPYRIAYAPIYLFFEGAKGATILVAESAELRYYYRAVTRPRIGPFHTRFFLLAGGLQGYGISMSSKTGDDRNRMKITGKVTNRETSKATFGIRLTPLPGNRIELGGGYRRRPDARFFGIGPETSEDDETFWTQEIGWGGISWQRDWMFALTSDLGIIYSGVGAFDPRDEEEPRISEVYDRGGGASGAVSLPGLGGRTDGVGYSLSLAHNTIEETGRPDGGGARRIAATYFQDRDGDNEDFWTFRVEAQQFLPLWLTSRSLALRGYVSWIEADDRSNIPFQRLMTNDEPDIIRGFRDFRWHDRGMTALSAEYRWPVFAERTVEGSGVDAYLFAEAGQVFGEFNEIKSDNLRNSVGGGFRWIDESGFGGRFEIARSAEEWVFRLRGDQIFQYAKSGLYHGRNPIPTR